MMDRRNRLLHRISAATNFNIETPWQHITNACQDFERDVPMLILYSAQAVTTGETNTCVLKLEGSLGIPEGHPLALKTLEIHEGNEGFVPALRSCNKTGKTVHMKIEHNLPNFLEGIQWRGHGEPSHMLFIQPLFVIGLVAGFVIMGLNPRRPYDEDQEQFVTDVGYVCTGALTASVSHEQAQAREAQLYQELTLREGFIRKMAEVASVGMYSISADGPVTYANSKFYTITGAPSEPEFANNLLFIDTVLEEDKTKACQAFDNCKLHRTTESVNIRLKRTWTPPGSSQEQHCWVLNSIIPNIENDGVTAILGCLTDISSNMWSLELQKQSTQAAEDAKKYQERFIVIHSKIFDWCRSKQLTCELGHYQS